MHKVEHCQSTPQDTASFVEQAGGLIQFDFTFEFVGSDGWMVRNCLALPWG